MKRELWFWLERAPILGLGAFLCCMGGILLWINGGSIRYDLRHAAGKGMFSLTTAFLLWLLAYGLTGLALAMTASASGCLPKNRAFATFVLGSAAYLLMLIWYALAFCTRLVIFPQILLALSVVLIGMIFVVIKRTFFCLSLILLAIEAIQVLFFIAEMMDFL